MSQIKVTQTRSLIGQTKKTRSIMVSLGLGRMNKTNTMKDNNCIRGQVNKVKHLVSWELIK